MLTIRENYLAVKAALPWLDSWRPAGFEAQFFKAPQSKLPAAVFPENIKLVMATATTLDAVEEMLKAGETVIYGTGDKKIIYDYLRLAALLKQYPRFYLSIANFCAMLGIESYVEMGVGGQLLYGSGMPFLDENAAMSVLILSKLDWKTRCDIAGNNARRLLGMPEIYTEEPEIRDFEPFIIDAHAHTSNAPGFTPFHIPVVGLTWKGWEPILNFYGIKTLLNAPNISFKVGNPTSIEAEGKLACESNGRIRLFEIIDPRDPNCIERMKTALELPECIGIKIHPQVHTTWASDDRYESVFELAGKYNKTVMSHTWEISYYNPRQKFSCPWLFEEHIKKHPETNFVLGHAGGRPSTFFEVRELCRKYPQVSMDLAGDYFHNGMLENMASAVGADRIMFGSDIDGFDPRCPLGMVLGSSLSDDEVRLILCENAKRIYHLN
ncbi:MAG: hypothetical protein E7050_12110 [Lentisphaerae bacterium]|nr:hypothetical protein [Lentisphaerota bacterium]